MELSGEDDQSNSAGAYSTGSGLQQQQQEWWNQTPLPDEQMREQTGGIKHMCQVIILKSRSGVDDCPHLLIR